MKSMNWDSSLLLTLTLSVIAALLRRSSALEFYDQTDAYNPDVIGMKRVQPLRDKLGCVRYCKKFQGCTDFAFDNFMCSVYTQIDSKLDELSAAIEFGLPPIYKRRKNVPAGLTSTTRQSSTTSQVVQSSSTTPQQEEKYTGPRKIITIVTKNGCSLNPCRKERATPHLLITRKEYELANVICFEKREACKMPNYFIMNAGLASRKSKCVKIGYGGPAEKRRLQTMATLDESSLRSYNFHAICADRKTYSEIIHDLIEKVAANIGKPPPMLSVQVSRFDPTVCKRSLRAKNFPIDSAVLAFFMFKYVIKSKFDEIGIPGNYDFPDNQKYGFAEKTDYKVDIVKVNKLKSWSYVAYNQVLKFQICSLV